MKIQSFIIGLRKTGTTWLYENYKEDSNICVSESVKESGFFLKNKLSINKYHDLFKIINNDFSKTLEIETGIFDSKIHLNKLLNYNQNSRVALILRNPSNYFCSRIIHCKRKGELFDNKQVSIKKIFEENKWLLDEYSHYNLLFLKKNFKYFKIFYFEDLEKDSLKFYNSISKFISGENIDFHPNITKKINISRSSKVAFLTHHYTRLAKLFRSFGLHFLVNYFRNNFIRKWLEKENTPNEYDFMNIEIEKYLKSINFNKPKYYK
jgi:hypothetical protein